LTILSVAQPIIDFTRLITALISVIFIAYKAISAYKTKELINDSAKQLSKSFEFTNFYVSKKEIDTLIDRIYTIEKATAKTKKEYSGRSRTGETKYFYNPVNLGTDEERDGGFRTEFAAAVSDINWITPNKQYSRGDTVLYDSIIIKCIKDGETDSTVPTVEEVKALQTQNITCGTAEFHIITNSGYTTWKPNTVFKCRVFLVGNNVFYYVATIFNDINVSLTGKDKPTFIWGTQKNGDYKLTYLGKDDEISG